MEKRVLDRRLAVMEDEGVVFRAGVNVGVDVPVDRLRSDFDAVLLAAGAGQPRDLPVPGRELRGIHFAMEYLTLQNRRCEGDADSRSTSSSPRKASTSSSSAAATPAPIVWAPRTARARSRCTSSSCCRDRPTSARRTIRGRSGRNIFRVSPAHEEGGERLYSVSTQRFTGDDAGRVRALQPSKVEMVRKDGRVQFEPVPGSEFEIPGRPRAAGDGLRRSGARRAGRPTSA